MALPVFRRFSLQDVPGAPTWIENIFPSLNIFCEGTINLLNKNLVIGENVQGQKFTSTFTTKASYATGTFTPIVLSYNGGSVPNCLLLGSIVKTDGSAILYPATITSWTANINKYPVQININYIAGLDINTTYKINIIAL